MDWIVVLTGGVQLQVSKESAAAIVAQVSRGALKAAAITVDEGVLVRVNDVLLVAPFASVIKAAAPVKLSASVGARRT